MRPSQALAQHRSQIREIALRQRVAGVSVFGSAIHGDDAEGSDLDVLVEFAADARPEMRSVNGAKAELEQ